MHVDVRVVIGSDETTVGFAPGAEIIGQKSRMPNPARLLSFKILKDRLRDLIFEIMQIRT